MFALNRTIVLDSKRRNDARVDRNEYFKKYGIYDNNGNYKKMMVGAPIIICIEGSYYDLNKLSSICIKGGRMLDGFIMDCKNPSKFSMTSIRFVWR